MFEVKKPWGRELIVAKTENYVMKVLEIDSGKRMSLQYHKEKEETIYVISKNPMLLWSSENDEDFKVISKGEFVHIYPGDVHRFGATKDYPCVIIECSTTELEDIIRIKDDYGR